ncbi:YcxB family protein [Streptomyces sp. ISL-36]|uniref:YcxB family protein n=1 Tax=Streptomyces sp. ISL-36 TaxID=2819182 RepID=UPI001BEC404D|nr:YcxB family protein [Streptomyces sp. ISL-36]MBT2439324.1 YcxB family protein [Streptomyces sp. ISL-36]
MARETAPGSVELAYVPTLADATEAVRVRVRHSPAGRRMRWLPAAAVLAFLVVALELFGPGEPDPVRVVLMAGLGVLALVMGPLAPRLMARGVHRMVEPQGEFRAVVDDDGVRWTARDSETTSRWQMLPQYVETPTLFVLLTPDKFGVGVAFLPKRAVSGPDGVDAVDRLRAILDRHTTRL